MKLKYNKTNILFLVKLLYKKTNINYKKNLCINNFLECSLEYMEQIKFIINKNFIVAPYKILSN